MTFNFDFCNVLFHQLSELGRRVDSVVLAEIAALIIPKRAEASVSIVSTVHRLYSHSSISNEETNLGQSVLATVGN